MNSHDSKPPRITSIDAYRGLTVLFDNGSPLRVLAFPLVVIGANSIFIYCAYHLTNGWVRDTLSKHLALP